MTQAGQRLDDAHADAHRRVAVAVGRSKLARLKIKRAAKEIRFRKLRSRAANAGIAHWAAALSTGTVGALILAFVLSRIMDGVLPLSLGILVGYVVVGGPVFWILRDLDEEGEGDVAAIRARMVRVAMQKKADAQRDLDSSEEDARMANQLISRINAQTQSMQGLQQPPAMTEIGRAAPDAILFRYKDITVNRMCIRSTGGRFDLDYVLSVKTTTAFFGGARVTVFDLTRSSTSYRFPNRSVAADFIRAIRDAKGSITVEPENDGWFIIWWS